MADRFRTLHDTHAPGLRNYTRHLCRHSSIDIRTGKGTP